MRNPKRILSLFVALLLVALALLLLVQDGEEDAQASFSKLAGMLVATESGSFIPGPITMEDDPSLGKLGEDLLQLLVDRDASAYLDSSVVSPEILGHVREIGEADIPVIRDGIRSALRGSREGVLNKLFAAFSGAPQSAKGVERVIHMASELDVPGEEGTFWVKSIEVGSVAKNSSDSDVLVGYGIEIDLALTPDAIGKLDGKYQGEYALYVDLAMRSIDGWGLIGHQIRWISLPDALLGEEGKAALQAEAYAQEFGTLMPGTAAPEFAFYDLEDGSELPSKAELKDKVLVLEFWATWCGPCQAPMAKLQTYVEQNPGWEDEVEVLTVSVDSNPKKALAHLNKNGWTSTRNVWGGPGELGASAPSAYKVEGIPAMYVIGANGMIAKAGDPRSMDVPALVEFLLDNPDYTAPEALTASSLRKYLVPAWAAPHYADRFLDRARTSH